MVVRADGAEQKKEEEESGEELLRAEEIEKSIRKKFHKKTVLAICQAVREYELVQEGDRIAVCISGGKDSMLMAKLFQELKKHNKFPFEVEYLVMDPGYSELNRKLIEQNAKMMGIPIKIFESDIFDAVFDVENLRVIYVPECEEGISTVRQKNLDATRSHLDTTMMM